MAKIPLPPAPATTDQLVVPLYGVLETEVIICCASTEYRVQQYRQAMKHFLVARVLSVWSRSCTADQRHVPQISLMQAKDAALAFMGLASSIPRKWCTDGPLNPVPSQTRDLVLAKL